MTPTATARPRRPIVPFTQRIFSAMLLRRDVYEYTAAERTTTGQAVAIVCIAAMLQPSPLTQELRAWGMIILMLFGVARWLVFATLVVYPISRLITRRPVPFRPLLRCLGFAEAPAIINALQLFGDQSFPEPVRVGVWLWLLAANVVAVRAALQVSTRRAAVIAAISFVFYLLIGLANAIILSNT